MRGVVLLALVPVLMPALSQAQEYPTKPINVIIPTAPGNGQDVITRALMEEAKKFIEQPFIAVNKPGGGGTVGLISLAKRSRMAIPLQIPPPSRSSSHPYYAR